MTTSSLVSPQAAAAELTRRRRARRSLIAFTEYTYRQYQADPAHRLIASALEDTITGHTDRLMIFAPPQHGKSELFSIRYPAYRLALRPDDPGIIASYAADLAQRQSRHARGCVESDEFQRLFPGVGTRQDSRAVNRWDIAGHLGGVLAAGVDGGVTGNPAKFGIIDDPLKGAKEAASKTVRDSCWAWYKMDFNTRLHEGGVVVLGMTRWHEDDLAGRLISHQPGRWRILRLPALAETQEERDIANARLGIAPGLPDPLGRHPGEPLCPRRFSRRALEVKRSELTPREWSALYQGSPYPPMGEYFLRDQWRIVDNINDDRIVRVCRYWDKAGTAGGGAFSCGVLIGIWDDRRYVVIGEARGQWEAHERNRRMREVSFADHDRWGRRYEVRVEREPGSGGKESAQLTARMLAPLKVSIDHVTSSKESRWESFAGQQQAGNVDLLRGAWNDAYIDEMAAVPNGPYKDRADASSGGFMRLAQRAAKGRARNRRKPHSDSTR